MLSRNFRICVGKGLRVSSFSSLGSRYTTTPASNLPNHVKSHTKNAKDHVRGDTKTMAAMGTSTLSPKDIAYSCFITRHAPLEIAHALSKAQPLSQQQVSEDLQETVLWTSATGLESEVVRLPATLSDKLDNLHMAESEEFDVDDLIDPSQNHIKVTVKARRKQSLESLFRAVTEGLNQVNFLEHERLANMSARQGASDVFYGMTSTKRKRKLKMNKHKYQKRRKEQEAQRKKLGK